MADLVSLPVVEEEIDTSNSIYDDILLYETQTEIILLPNRSNEGLFILDP